MGGVWERKRQGGRFGVTEISVKDLGYVGTPEQHAFSKLFR